MKIDRQKVLDKYGCRCGYCGTELTLKTMQVDHMWPLCMALSYEAIQKIKHFDNLMPSCRQCNHYKRSDTVEQFRLKMLDLHKRIESIYIHKVAVLHGMATIKPFDGKFYFEKITHEK